VFDFCDVIARGRMRAGQTIEMRAWYETMGMGDALGSPKCEKLMMPDFSGPFSVTSEGSPNAETSQVLGRPRQKPPIPILWDFNAEFQGTLEKRTGYYATGPVPLDAPPPLDEMPYIFHVTAIRHIKVERANWKVPPPPSKPG